jgi:hypothetical protein
LVIVAAAAAADAAAPLGCVSTNNKKKTIFESNFSSTSELANWAQSSVVRDGQFLLTNQSRKKDRTNFCFATNRLSAAGPGRCMTVYFFFRT